MKPINLYILNIGNATATSGVDRYLNVLLNELKNYSSDIHIYKIELIRDRSLIFHEQIEKEGYIEINIPFPINHDEIIGERYWMRKYNEYVYELIKNIFDKDKLAIIHLHTLNLIDLALYIKSQTPSKIITHLHCIPWKNLFNINRKVFNDLYFDSYLSNSKVKNKDLYITNNCELDSYLCCDRVICVTDCAKTFLKRTISISEKKITVISNGIYNTYIKQERKEEKKKDRVFNCLYVGVLSKSKGIHFILEALRKVSVKGYQVNINVAGAYSIKTKNDIEINYPDVSINMLGRIPFETLKEYYYSSDMGLIASLQEQCSYVAIEMAMFGLPIITTAIDGLDDMFTDGMNALKVNTLFSKVFGLRVDTDMYAEKIISLIENETLRIELGNNARKLYKEKFTSEQMVRETIKVYKELAYE
ncbi:glycosyltransferase family 4 protein [Bacteroidales bacterium OttesenSCG-928-M11]|nr:glycosyltransferase family 4 protein [Bacteroidales bacterium OttesenSCG-928-M11]